MGFSIVTGITVEWYSGIVQDIVSNIASGAAKEYFVA
jgi:hypothetical protein